MSRQMIKRGLKGTRFSQIEPVFPADLHGIGWYIHMPFCQRLCPYCSFRSLRYFPSKVGPYINGVKREILTYRDKLGKIKVGDVYFGGGTPSLTWEGVIEIIETLTAKFELDGEIGLEANPEDINNVMADALWDAGITKISLGVQSFDDEILRSMGRNYDAKTATQAIELLLAKGFYVSIDLMHGLPQQRIASLLSDLEKATRAGVHQVSHYPLMLFPYTRWYQDVQKGHVAIPSSRLEREMFYTVCDFLTANGYSQATCWDFTNAAKAGTQYVTCTRDENIGVGLSAYTKIGSLFYVNTFSLREYIKRVETSLPIATGTSMSPNRVMRQWFMMGLYRLKIGKAEFEKHFGVKIERVMGRFLLMLRLLNVVDEHPSYIQVTRRGMYYASLMTKTFMLTFPARYIEECLRDPWPGDFQI